MNLAADLMGNMLQDRVELNRVSKNGVNTETNI